MAKQVLAIIVLLGLGVVGCERKGKEKAPAPAGEGTRQESPTTQPGVSVTEPPSAPEPAPRGTETEGQRDQSSATTAPAGQQAGAGESSPQALAAKPLLTATPAPNEEAPVSEAAAKDPRLTGSWSSDRQAAAGPVQMTFTKRGDEKLVKWSAQTPSGSEQQEAGAQDTSKTLAQGMSADYWFDDQGNLMLQYGPDKRTLQLKPASPEAEAAASR